MLRAPFTMFVPVHVTNNKVNGELMLRQLSITGNEWTKKSRLVPMLIFALVILPLVCGLFYS
jgi:hypothetical protein